jgi:adenine-specific DNA-methyltransferase
MATLVDQILSAKKQNPEADTSQLEREINQLVYKLYNLTEEEIKIIESRYLLSPESSYR